MVEPILGWAVTRQRALRGMCHQLHIPAKEGATRAQDSKACTQLQQSDGAAAQDGHYTPTLCRREAAMQSCTANLRRTLLVTPRTPASQAPQQLVGTSGQQRVGLKPAAENPNAPRVSPGASLSRTAWSCAKVSSFMLPGRPVVCRLYSFCEALLPVTTTFSALTTTTKPPMSTDGVYVGLCLPLRRSLKPRQRPPRPNLMFLACWPEPHEPPTAGHQSPKISSSMCSGLHAATSTIPRLFLHTLITRS